MRNFSIEHKNVHDSANYSIYFINKQNIAQKYYFYQLLHGMRRGI